MMKSELKGQKLHDLPVDLPLSRFANGATSLAQPSFGDEMQSIDTAERRPFQAISLIQDDLSRLRGSSHTGPQCPTDQHIHMTEGRASDSSRIAEDHTWMSALDREIKGPDFQGSHHALASAA
jgi:hypothetical protein